MNMPTHIESCPRCASSDNVRPKLLLIDETWVPAAGKDSRERYFADLRVSDIQPEQLHPQPLEQFVDGYYCDGCGRGFVSEESLQAAHERHPA